MSVLTLDGIQKRFRRLEVLRGVSLRVDRGEVVGLTGENGSGKSTLLQIAVGLLSPDGGRVGAAGSRGYCPQEPILFDSLTMEENLAYFAAGYGLGTGTVRARAGDLFERLRCAEHTARPVSTLSGGTKQKLNLIVSLLHDPDLLILDEPYQGFDFESYLAFWDLADELKRSGKSVLVVSHLIFDRERLDRLYTLQGGQAQEVA